MAMNKVQMLKYEVVIDGEIEVGIYNYKRREEYNFLKMLRARYYNYEKTYEVYKIIPSKMNLIKP